ncbi:hypothetical protein [Paraglaciecola sp.]|uniref:hypothetical protein n=1 Tax=Paraglaciecola sp. TaxID=1920173 RepID=UPI003EF9B3BC
MRIVLLISFALLNINAFAHTWDEPWHDQVVKGANSFSLFEVMKNSNNMLKLRLIKHIVGEKPEDNIVVDGYYLYNVASTSTGSDEHEFWLKKGQHAYIYLLKKDEQYKIATPTAGYSEIQENGTVASTYRHSLHKAQVEVDTYEATQKCIFDAIKGASCADSTISKYILKPLEKRVSILSPTASKDDFDLFFEQHVALETTYLIKYAIQESILLPFIKSKFFHTEIGAVRALAVSDSNDKESKLASFVTKGDGSDIAKVMAVIMLDQLNYKCTIALSEYLKDASGEEVALGGDFMDPRVSTWFPRSVKESIEWFLDKNSLNKKMQIDSRTSNN